jgi:hypothetical protein
MQISITLAEDYAISIVPNLGTKNEPSGKFKLRGHFGNDQKAAVKALMSSQCHMAWLLTWPVGKHPVDIVEPKKSILLSLRRCSQGTILRCVAGRLMDQ